MSDPALFPENLSRIILTGFMGAGKTTVGALLAERLGWGFVDSDHVVEERAGMTIAQIFERRGETAFRELEAAAVRDAGSEDRLVLALGGGALEMAATRGFLASQTDTLLVFLEAPLATMIARCEGHDNGPVRPVLADPKRLAERWRQRLPWYRQAHLTVETDELSPEAVVECIMERLKPWPVRSQPMTEPSSAESPGKPGVVA